MLKKLIKKSTFGVLGIILTVVGLWFNGLFFEFLWSPERTWLAIENVFNVNSPSHEESSEERFRFVLCWLENDRDGKNMKNVALAFTNIDGIDLVLSARIVKASNSGDKWRSGIRSQIDKILETWNADLAIVGFVKESNRALNLWFVPREGHGTLTRGDNPYVLTHATLGEDFHKDLRLQLTALALSATAPAADTEARDRVLFSELSSVTKKITQLLQNGTIIDDLDRSNLYRALGTAFAVLGDRDIGTRHILQAIDAYKKALEVFTPEQMPLEWASTQNSLGAAFASLGEKENSKQHLVKSIEFYNKALEVYTRDQTPMYWATTLLNLGGALTLLGKQNSSTQHLVKAVEIYEIVLEVLTSDQRPVEWAITQNNLGYTLTVLGLLENNPKRVELAVDAYNKALKERTREMAPLEWAGTQNNLGNALAGLGLLENNPKRVELAVDAYNKALEESTREMAPLEWVRTQNNLGIVLAVLGSLENNPRHFELAVDAYNKALEESYSGNGTA